MAGLRKKAERSEAEEKLRSESAGTFAGPPSGADSSAYRDEKTKKADSKIVLRLHIVPAQ
jgi:hypothetical protein